MRRFSPIGLIAALAVALLLFGASLARPAGAGVNTLRRAPAVFNVKNHCDAHGGVRVDPCSLLFASSNPGPFVVTVRLPRTKKGTLGENDTCAGIALVTPSSSNPDEYMVTALSSPGSCTATFAFTNKHGKQTGYANLSIVNEL